MTLPETLQSQQNPVEGILLVNKPRGKTSFSLVASLRKRLGVKKIGHAGTLDPFATGVMVMLIGRNYTRLSDRFLAKDKEYRARLLLGATTDTYDCEGKILATSDKCPLEEEVHEVLKSFQGWIDQVPPMFSAKKINGKKLYEMARKGQEVERKPVSVWLDTQLLTYQYPYLDLHVKASKGTYIRSLAYDIGQKLGCGAHLTTLERVRSGSFHLHECINADDIHNKEIDLTGKLIIHSLTD